VDKGYFRGGKKTQYDPAEMNKVIAIACDIAEGIAYLHEHDVVHGGEDALTQSLSFPLNDVITAYPISHI